MDKESNHAIINEFKHLYDEGYRCINYETDGKDHLFTIYLKNFEKEDTRTIRCDAEKGAILKNYINKLS
ncbi:MAG: hypothetical protein ACOCG5_03215 [Candidatus Alkaliphilus sp. MAG34]|nr:hypothetical protein [Clostridiales bacterium]